MTRFKICGVRTPADIDAAVAAGASAVGFCFHPASPRFITVQVAQQLAPRVPVWVSRVALLVDVPVLTGLLQARLALADTVQLHGTYSPSDCEEMALRRVILARQAVPGATLKGIQPYRRKIDAVLLDANVPGRHGGTGQLADWDEARRVRDLLGDLPLILAGGLTPDNVADAIAAVRPYAVDVASGVESAPGVKDPARIAAFGEAVRSAG